MLSQLELEPRVFSQAPRSPRALLRSTPDLARAQREASGDDLRTENTHEGRVCRRRPSLRPSLPSLRRRLLPRWPSSCVHPALPRCAAPGGHQQRHQACVHRRDDDTKRRHEPHRECRARRHLPRAGPRDNLAERAHQLAGGRASATARSSRGAAWRRRRRCRRHGHRAAVRARRVPHTPAAAEAAAATAAGREAHDAARAHPARGWALKEAGAGRWEGRCRAAGSGDDDNDRGMQLISQFTPTKSLCTPGDTRCWRHRRREGQRACSRSQDSTGVRDTAAVHHHARRAPLSFLIMPSLVVVTRGVCGRRRARLWLRR